MPSLLKLLWRLRRKGQEKEYNALLDEVSYNFKVLAALKIKDLMVKDVLTVEQSAPLLEALRVMSSRKVASLVVTRKEKPAGILTERDVVYKLSLLRAVSKLRVNDIYTPKILSIPQEHTLLDASHIMKQFRIRKLAVMQQGELKGILTQTDVVKVIDTFCPLNLYEQKGILYVGEVVHGGVYAVDKQAPLAECQRVMRQQKIGCVVVRAVSGEGIITERDFVRAVVQNPTKLKSLKAGDLMQSPMFTIPPNKNIFYANKVMLENHFRRLGVRREDRLLGMITQTDIHHAIMDFVEHVDDRVKGIRFVQKALQE